MKAIKDGKKYYKYVYGTFIQPTLTSNGVVGGNSMSVYTAFSTVSSHNDPANTYKIFTPNTDRLGFYCNQFDGYMEIQIYLPNPTKLTTLSFTVMHVTDSSGASYGTKLYAGKYMGSRENLVLDIGTVADSSTYNNTNLPTTNYYQYYTLLCNNGGVSGEDSLYIKNVYVAGQERTVIPGTASDYDFYVDTYKLPYINEKYYAIGE